jgi:hypothetical protein
MLQPAFCLSCRARICARCGSELPAGRVQALPSTMLCARCSEELGGEEARGAVLQHGGKAQSLKKNYTGVKVTRQRRDLARLLPADPPERCPRCRERAATPGLGGE